ncbi:oxygenase MpaB family protein [Mycobacterium sp. MUNTM1]
MVLQITDDAGRAARIAAAREQFPDNAVDVFVDNMFRTDVLVDAVAEELAGKGPVGWRRFDEALALARPSVRGAPVSLEPMLEPLLRPPSWFDAAQVRWGAALWWRFWLSNQIGLTGALRIGYKYGDLNKPQAMNGHSTVMAARRYEETGRWVLDATEPGALIPGGNGFAATVKIRLVHAMVRRRLRTDPRWNTTAWGAPIHLAGMAVTNSAFLVLPLAALKMVGVEFTDDESDAVRALWCWIGYLMGIPDDLLPFTIENAGLVTQLANAIFAPADHDTRVLDKAVMRNGIRAERALPRLARPAAAPLLRPAISYVIWGISNTIVNQIEEHADDPEKVDHPVARALRPVVARRERLRKSGKLGSDYRIAEGQRNAVTRALTLIDAAPRSVHPREAVLATS